MTCAFTRRYGLVYACDLDAGFLERCREAVARFGKVDRLRTIEVADGRSLDVPDGAADLAFSYITLQHCDRDDALALDRTRRCGPSGPEGRSRSNFRSWSGTDPIVLPLGALMRGHAPPARASASGCCVTACRRAWRGRPTASIPTR